ncbi:MAG: DUF2505 domain-containing protein [Rhodococcus sp. (in: high G+C Gram-positive bacteria)]
MGRKFDFTEDFDVAPAQAHAALTDEALWAKRTEEVSDHASVEYTHRPDGGFDVVISEGVGASVLPGIVKKVIRGDLTITRKDSWGPLEGDRASGTLEGGSTGLPSKVRGTFQLAPHGTGSRLTLTGTAEVKVPFVGGKIEGMVTDMIGKMVHSESKQARKYLAEKS